MSSASITPPTMQQRPLTAASEDVYAVLTRAVLANACAIMGGMDAWVMRHEGGGCQPVMMLDSERDIDLELRTAIVGLVDVRLPGASYVIPWKKGALLCASFKARAFSDGCVCSLGMMFEGRFELTEHRTGILDGLRCSLEVLFGHFPDTGLKTASGTAQLPVVCSCCRRLHTTQHGWMHWDELRVMETGDACSHTVCEQCAGILYDIGLNDRD